MRVRVSVWTVLGGQGRPLSEGVTQHLLVERLRLRERDTEQPQVRLEEQQPVDARLLLGSHAPG